MPPGSTFGRPDWKAPWASPEITPFPPPPPCIMKSPIQASLLGRASANLIPKSSPGIGTRNGRNSAAFCELDAPMPAVATSRFLVTNGLPTHGRGIYAFGSGLTSFLTDSGSRWRLVLRNDRTLSGLPRPETRGKIRGRNFRGSFDRAV